MDSRNAESLKQEKSTDLDLVRHIIGSRKHSKIVTQSANGTLSLFDLTTFKRIDNLDLGLRTASRYNFFASRFTEDGTTFYSSTHRFSIENDTIVRALTPYVQEHESFPEWIVVSDKFSVHSSGISQTLHRIDDWNESIATFGDSESVEELDRREIVRRNNMRRPNEIKGYHSASKLVISSNRQIPIIAHDTSGKLKYEFDFI